MACEIHLRPAGGAKNRNVAVWFVFGFVAIWHDAEAKLIAWGALNALFFVAEHFIRIEYYKFIYRRGLSDEDWWPLQFKVLGGTTFVFVMMAVNSIGYSIGINGGEARRDATRHHTTLVATRCDALRLAILLPAVRTMMLTNTSSSVIVQLSFASRNIHSHPRNPRHSTHPRRPSIPGGGLCTFVLRRAGHGTA